METTLKSLEIYPNYFDSSVTISVRRKYALGGTTSKPTSKEIEHALDSLGINRVAEPDKMHPKAAGEKGRISMSEEQSRSTFARKPVEMIRELRTSNDLRANGGSNALKLVPISENESKKK